MTDHRYADQDAMDALLQPFRGQFYLELPPDRRIIDRVRMKALRERILSPYSYKWRGEDANFEIAEAIFGARRVENSDNVIHLITDTMMRDGNGQSTFDRRPGSEFQKHYYVTAAISTLPDYIHSHGAAGALLGKVVPGFGYEYEFRPDSQRLRLVGNDEAGPWIESDFQPKMLVAAVLERLERYSEQAPPWRRL